MEIIKNLLLCKSLNNLAGLIGALSNLAIFIERILEFSEVYLISVPAASCFGGLIISCGTVVFIEVQDIN